MAANKIDTHELAWAAGFFDGEGCASITKPGRYERLCVSVGQSELTTLERFKAAVLGLGHINGPYVRSGKPFWMWNASSFEQTQAVVAMLWPRLSLPKREQASRAMKRALVSHKVPRLPWKNQYGQGTPVGVGG